MHQQANFKKTTLTQGAIFVLKYGGSRTSFLTVDLHAWRLRIAQAKLSVGILQHIVPYLSRLYSLYTSHSIGHL